ncbi:MAG: endonuclease/exonuclease/phosphatase family protein [Actinomycetota bacterium]
MSSRRDVDGVLRIVQLNIGSLIEPEWERRRHEIVAWLDRLDPDVVCFEEVWGSASSENTASWLADHATGEWHHAFGGFPVPPPLSPDPSARFGSAVLSRWSIDGHTVHRLPTDPADTSPLVNSVGWELLHVETAGLDVFACHLAPAPIHGLHRQLQVLAIDELIRAARIDKDPDPVPGGPRRRAMPAILCGDFNAEPDSDEIRFLSSLTSLDNRTAFYQDAWRMAGEGPGYTQDWRANPIAEAMNINRKRIDYVFVGDPFLRLGGAGRVERAALAFHEPLTGIVASDHVGLVVDVRWPERPA